MNLEVMWLLMTEKAIPSLKHVRYANVWTAVWEFLLPFNGLFKDQDFEVTQWRTSRGYILSPRIKY